jgi:glutamine synthetase
MPRAGVDIITSNCEYAGSQWEINFGPGKGLASPDTAFTFKNGVKEIARQDGYTATFMSKPFSGQSGSGCHTHISLVDTTSHENVFGASGAEDGITDLCRQFLAGQLKYAAAVDAVIAPTVNCHRRRRKHTFSPTNVSWGFEDRSALLRVKRATPESTHIENRGPSALSNPYLVGAALLSAGLAGIEQGLQPQPPSGDAPAEEDASLEPLPSSLRSALDALSAEADTEAFFGKDFLTAYTTMRSYELSRFDDWVSDWERQEYVEIF